MPEYDFFMVYELEDSGGRGRLDITEEQFRENNGQNVLHPEQVVVIVKEELRRIFIWKGAKSSVRKRFISSRIASGLQEELIKAAAFHRCKIVSVDQGDETTEFLNTFGFVSIEVTEKLADMRYIRNVDREKMINEGIIPDEVVKVIKVEKKETPVFEDLEDDKDISLPSAEIKTTKSPVKTAPTPIKRKTAPTPRPTFSRKHEKPTHEPTHEPSRIQTGLSKEEEKEIIEKILKNEVPESFKRQNLVIGHTLYGAVSKKVKVFGKEIEETEWEQVKSVPKEMIEIENHKLRIYFNHEKGTVEGIEVLEGNESDEPKKVGKTQKKTSTTQPDFNKMTIKDLKSYCSEQGIKVPPNSKKVDMIKLINEASNKPKPSARRSLPKIPKA